MRAEVARDLSASARDFHDHVWPLISDWCQGGELLPVETVSEKGFERRLDMLAGIDAWQVVSSRGAMRGIASRIQYGGCGWASFTIRRSRGTGARTELEKRLSAHRNRREGWLLPALTVQAYLSNRTDGQVLCVGVVYTADLYDFIESGTAGKDWTVQRNPVDGNTFAVVWWDDLSRAGYTIRCHEAPGARIERRPPIILTKRLGA